MLSTRQPQSSNLEQRMLSAKNEAIEPKHVWSIRVG